MNEIEKAKFAVNMVRVLLIHEDKILAIALIRNLFGVGLKHAKEFTEQVELCMWKGTK